MEVVVPAVAVSKEVAKGTGTDTQEKEPNIRPRATTNGVMEYVDHVTTCKLSLFIICQSPITKTRGQSRLHSPYQLQY